eukprot:3008517-Ditylum_brightwellii.AAC.1
MARKHCCSKKFAKSGSSKSMECLGATDIAQQMIDGKMNIFLNEIIIDYNAAAMKMIHQKQDGGLLSNDSYIANKLAGSNHRARGFGDYLYEMRDTPQKMSRVNRNDTNGSTATSL